MTRTSTYIDTPPIVGRVWRVSPTFATDGTIIHILMRWGCAERQFKPGEENDSVSKAGLSAALAHVAVQHLYPASPPSDDFDLIEQFT